MIFLTPLVLEPGTFCHPGAVKSSENRHFVFFSWRVIKKRREGHEWEVTTETGGAIKRTTATGRTEQQERIRGETEPVVPWSRGPEDQRGVGLSSGPSRTTHSFNQWGGGWSQWLNIHLKTAPPLSTELSRAFLVPHPQPRKKGNLVEAQVYTGQ